MRMRIVREWFEKEIEKTKNDDKQNYNKSFSIVTWMQFVLCVLGS